MEVIKRDGRTVKFDKRRIIDAILKAAASAESPVQDTTKQLAETIAEDIINSLPTNSSSSVEEIQDLVESSLMGSNRKDIAKSYVLYRDKRTRVREHNGTMSKQIAKRLKSKNVDNQNANVDEKSFGGKIGAISGDVMKDYALYHCMSKMSRDNHINNMIYIHDLDHYAVGDHNCLTIPFDDLLAKGFSVRQTDIRPAGSVGTAFQLIAVIFQLESLQQFGGVSASHLDWTMVPYVRKSLLKHYIFEYLKSTDEFYSMDFSEMSQEEIDEWVKTNRHKYLDAWSLKDEDFYIGSSKLDNKLYQRALFETRQEVFQSAEAMYHNLNSLQSRSGNQLPFTSINYGTCTLPEGRMVTRALLEGSIQGLGKYHRTSIFPCGIFQSMRGVNRKPGDRNYDLFKLALKSTAQRLYPNYANVDWSGNEGYDRNDPCTYFSTMGCRTANGWDVNGFGQLKDGRGNICPVTIILPTLAMMVQDSEDKVSAFLELLDKKIHEARDMLIERFDYICSQSPESARFLYENNVIAGYDGKNIRSALRHGTLAVGQLGLAEALQLLVGCDHTEERGMEVAKQIESLFQKRCAEFKKEYSLNFGVYYTPAENLCFTAMKKFKEKYGEIPNVSDKKFFTNSMHVPVWRDVTLSQKIDIESQLTGYSSAGCITYVELDGAAKGNLKALEDLVLYAMEKDIPYFAINVPNDTCMNCGYQDEIGNQCPECGSDNIQRLRRVTGYLTGNYTTAFNEGKVQEVEMRVKHRQGTTRISPKWSQN